MFHPYFVKKEYGNSLTKTLDVAEQTATFTPDVLIIPGIVAFDPELQPLDTKVYGVVYWLERLRDGRCFASNATIGKIIGASGGGVANSLVRLVKQGYVNILLDGKGQRINISTQVRMTVNPYSNDEGGVNQMINIGSNTKKEKYTSETQASIDKIYKAWLVYMVIDEDVRNSTDQDERQAAYLQAQKHTRLTDKRKAKIASRLADAGEVMILKAIKNMSLSAFHRGENDNNWKADIEFICKSYEKIEEWANK